MENLFPEYVNPESLCKYRSLKTECEFSTVERAILHDELNFSIPLDFNDPFDCYPNLYIGDQHALVQKICAAQGRAYDEKLVITDEGMREGWLALLRNTAISCFSSDDSNPIMWAHYADNHRGVCLLYNTHWDDKYFHAFPVTYSEVRPDVDYSELNNPQIVIDGLCTKSLYWEKEFEHRMIIPGEQPGVRKLPATMLKGVVLGNKINPQIGDRIIALAQSRPGLAIYRAEICTELYAINNVLLS